MANLSDFIGSVVSNISQSRANADLQTIEIAKKYAADSLLKHFSVPRFRIDSVELSIPIAVNGYAQVKAQSFTESNKQELSKQTVEILKRHFLGKATEMVDKKILEAVSRQVEIIADKYKIQERNAVIEKFTSNITSLYPDWIFSAYKELKLKTPLKLEIVKAQNAIHAAILNATIAFTNTSLKSEIVNEMDVIVDTAKLREITQADKVMITMKISEYGMEWIKMEDENGQTETRLLPE